MSTADSGYVMPLALAPGVGPGIAAGVMSVEAGADTALDASRRGASAGEALTAGILPDTAEYVFEKYSIGKLFDIAKISSKGIKGAVLKAIASMGVNASDEGLTEVSNIITDTLVMQGKSNYELTIRDLMEDEGTGYSAFFKEYLRYRSD